MRWEITTKDYSISVATLWCCFRQFGQWWFVKNVHAACVTVSQRKGLHRAPLFVSVCFDLRWHTLNRLAANAQRPVVAAIIRAEIDVLPATMQSELALLPR